MVVDRIRGSKWNRALPGAEFGNLNLWFPDSSTESAAANACRLSLSNLRLNRGSARRAAIALRGSKCFPGGVWGGAFLRKAAAPAFPRSPKGGEEIEMKTKKTEKVTYSKCGGQAVMEGVMMASPDTIALAVRQPNGKIALRTRPRKKLAEKYPILGWPIIRGVVNFVYQIYDGMKTLTESAEMAGMEAEEPSPFEKKLAKFFHAKVDDVMMVCAVVLALALSILLFFVVPTAVESLLKRVISSRVLLNVLGGLVRIAVFLGYVMAVSQLKEIRRVFMYHGAEHKSIHCLEHGDPLTVENAQKYTTLHPRCGTSFLVIVMVISIFIFTLLGTNSGNVFARVGSRLALLPLVAGVSYELLQWLGRAEDNWFVRALKWPGLMTQKITTKQPTDDMVEVALVALKAALGDPHPLPEEPEEAASDAAAEPEEKAEA